MIAVTQIFQGDYNYRVSESCCTPACTVELGHIWHKSAYIFAHNTILLCHKQVAWVGPSFHYLGWGSFFVLLVNPSLVLKKKRERRKKKHIFYCEIQNIQELSWNTQNYGAAAILFHCHSAFIVELLRCCYSCNIKERYFMDATWKVI